MRIKKYNDRFHCEVQQKCSNYIFARIGKIFEYCSIWQITKLLVIRKRPVQLKLGATAKAQAVQIVLGNSLAVSI